jgi:methyl-accepting chemotaxis protein
MNFNFLSNTPIFRRLFIAFAAATLIPAIVIALLGTFYVNSLVSRGQAVTTAFQAQSEAYAQQVNLQRMEALLTARNAQVFAYLGQGSNADPSLRAGGELANIEINILQTTFDQSLSRYQQQYELATSSNMAPVNSILVSQDPNTIIIKDQQRTLDLAKTQWATYKTYQQNELKTLDDILTQKNPSISQDYATAYGTLFQAQQSYINLENSWQHLVNLAHTMGNIVSNVGDAQINPVRIATVIAIVSTILLVFAIGYAVNQTITVPLRQLANLTRRIAKGETSARATIGGRDEIHLVASSMNNMLDNIVHLIQDAQAQRDNLQAQVEKLVSEVSGVGEGDLRVQAEVTADALGVLADSFNYMVEELSSLVVRVKMVAHEVEGTTVSILDRMTQLVETGDMQIHQIGQAAIEVERMAEDSRRVAERAQGLLSVARSARLDAQGGRESVQQAVEGMGRIHENVQATASKVDALGESSKEINNIVDVISQIAHQTNRLALDAAIQAAMAGENGKGFGAVAADIRRLAERAKEEASSIARIVRSVREDISAAAVAMQDTERETSAGARLTQDAGVALESLFAAVEQQAREIETINQVANQQVQSSNSVAQVMRAVSDTTQQSSLSTREASQNMERLSRLVEQLRASTEAFKLRENQDAYAPIASVSVYPEGELENQLTMSGIFRTVTASAVASGVSSGPYPYNALPPPSTQATGAGTGRPNGPFPFHPATPNQPNQPNQPAYPNQPNQFGNAGPWRTPTPAPARPGQPNPQWEQNQQWQSQQGQNQQGQQWYGEPFDEHMTNGNGNRNGNGNNNGNQNW